MSETVSGFEPPLTRWRRGLSRVTQAVAWLWAALILLAVVLWLVEAALDTFVPSVRWRAPYFVTTPLAWARQTLLLAGLVLGLLELVLGPRRLRRAGFALVGAAVLELAWTILVLQVLVSSAPPGGQPSPGNLVWRALYPLGAFAVSVVTVALISLSTGYRRSMLLSGSDGAADER